MKKSLHHEGHEESLHHEGMKVFGMAMSVARRAARSDAPDGR
jgi:hypothetical protein